MSEKLETGTIVEGKVVRVKPFGAIVAFENGSQGLCIYHRSLTTSSRILQIMSM